MGKVDKKNMLKKYIVQISKMAVEQVEATLTSSQVQTGTTTKI